MGRTVHVIHLRLPKSACHLIVDHVQNVMYSPLLGKLSPDVGQGTRGGFLAEEMGLGKTVEVLALVLANPAPPSVLNGTLVTNKKTQSTYTLSRGTLVVCKVRARV